VKGDPPPLAFETALLLVGGAPPPPGALARARDLTGAVVCADAGADRWTEAGFDAPDAVIGDMDSVDDPAAWRARLGPRFIHMTEQDSTDLEKSLRLTRAPLTLGVGFMDGRLDHTLAALHALMRAAPRAAALLGAEDVAALIPPDWVIDVVPGARISLFPLVEIGVTACAGLEWPAAGLRFRPGFRIGTSNRAARDQVRVVSDAPGMIAMVETRFLPQLLTSLTRPEAGAWPLSTPEG
jgi:thiamine pyrophosphokinase